MDAHRARMETLKAELQDPRVSLAMERITKELMHLKSVGGDYPAGSKHDWYNAIYALIDEGYLEIQHGTHVRRVKPADLPPEPVGVKESKPVQLDLF